MDSLSKNVCLIGVLHILAYMVIALAPLKDVLKIMFFSSNAEEEWSNRKPIVLLTAVLAFLFLMIILAILMIHGILKKRHVFLVPFLVVHSLVLAAIIILFCWHLVHERLRSIYVFESCVFEIGIQLMTLYPTCTLFVKLRSHSQQSVPVQYESETAGDALKQKLCA